MQQQRPSTAKNKLISKKYVCGQVCTYATLNYSLGFGGCEKATIQKDSCTPKFTAALFTIAKTWKQPKCLSTDEWIMKMYIYVYVCIYNEILAICKKEVIILKSERERYDITYM